MVVAPWMVYEYATSSNELPSGCVIKTKLQEKRKRLIVIVATLGIASTKQLSCAEQHQKKTPVNIPSEAPPAVASIFLANVLQRANN